MTDLRARLEAAIEAALDAGIDPDEAIAVLDVLDGDPDCEPEIGEECDLPPLMDGGWGYQLGRLQVWDCCPCCGHPHFDGHMLPVVDFGF